MVTRESKLRLRVRLRSFTPNLPCNAYSEPSSQGVSGTLARNS